MSYESGFLGVPIVASPPNTGSNAINDGRGTVVADGNPSLGIGTDNQPGLQALLDAFGSASTTTSVGGYLLLPPGFYGISAPLIVRRAGTRFGGLVGGQATRGTTVIFALPNFVGGSLLQVNVPPGDKGAYIERLKLDGNNVAGVTNCLELAAGSLSKVQLDNIQTANAPVGMLTNDNCQSTDIERCAFNVGHTTSLQLGTNNRQMKFTACIFQDSSTGALIGPDDAVAGNTNTNIQFIGCEFYTGGATTAPAVTVRNAVGCSFFGCWAEHAGTQNPLARVIQWGTATASADRAMWCGGRMIGNSKATTILEIVQAKDCEVITPVGLTAISGNIVTLTDATSRAVIWGATVNTRTGSRLVYVNGNNPLSIYGSQINSTVTTPAEAVLVSGVDASVTGAVAVTLTAARVVGAPLGGTGALVVGQTLAFLLTQGGAGGFAVTWNAIFKVTWSDVGNATGKKTGIQFMWDGTNWIQIGAQAPYV